MKLKNKVSQDNLENTFEKLFEFMSNIKDGDLFRAHVSRCSFNSEYRDNTSRILLLSDFNKEAFFSYYIPDQSRV